MRHSLRPLRRLSLALLLAAGAALADAPVALTASDGTGLTLVSYRARAVVEDPLCFTELTLVFENPRDRVLEGQFRITLPEGASVSRFAMKLEGRWQEGEVVEKQAARRAYEDFLHRRQDPALLEQAQGNEFSARVFPIPARGKKELVVSWSHALPASGVPYLLPLKGLPLVEALEVQAFSQGRLLGELRRAKVVPDRDFTAAPPTAGPAVLRAGELLVARVRAEAAPRPEPLGSLLLLVDTSASRALGFGAQLELVRALVARLAAAEGGLPVTVAAFDQEVRAIYEGPASGFGPAALQALKARRALGASDVSGALAWALEQGRTRPRARVLLVTDGVFTAGEVEGDRLLAAVSRLKEVGVQRLDAVAVGGIRDAAVLGRLAAGRLPRAGLVLDGELGAEGLARRLGTATLAAVPVVAEGARSVWPKVLTGVQGGDEALVYLELASPTAAPALRVGGALVDLSQGARAVERPLLERAWARARIEALLDEQDRAADGPTGRAAVRETIVALSVKHRVLSPYTALLVLETEADYARFNLPRSALADILTVAEDGKVAVARRDPLPAAPRPGERPKLSSAPMKKARDTGLVLRPPAADEAGPAEAEVGADKELAVPPEDRRASPPPPPAPAPSGTAGLVLRGAGSGGGGVAARPAPAVPMAEPARRASATDDAFPVSRAPYEGPFKAVMEALAQQQVAAALEQAQGWREEAPGDVLALVALGEACEAAGDVERAARAYGSILDLFPARADLRRFAGGRLERLKGRAALELAADAFGKAVEQRPDHPASHRMRAFALLRLGRPRQAFEALELALKQRSPEGRFAGVDRILQEDLGLVAAAWRKAEPGAAPDIRARLAAAGGVEEAGPSLRFVLTWETDANDVDFHIADAKGGHAYYSAPELPSGGRLYADVTTGYGPECFTIRAPPGKRAGPYRLSAHYYSRGPMGYGMGKLEIVEHDGQGGLTFEERPYVVMVDGAFVDLGQVSR